MSQDEDKIKWSDEGCRTVANGVLNVTEGSRASVYASTRDDWPPLAHDLAILLRSRLDVIDSLRAELASVTRERDEARTMKWKSDDETRAKVRIAKLERELNYAKQCADEKIEAGQGQAAEQIAAWLDERDAAEVRAGGYAGTKAAYVIDIAADIRAGRWRKDVT